jgi:hypothetical protein
MGGRIAIGLVALLGLTALAACGDDDDSTEATTAATTATVETSTTGSTATTTGATSGSVGDASEEDYVAAVAATFTQGGEDDLQLTDEQADCVAPKWIDTIGVDRLKDKGISPDDIGDDADDADISDLGLSEDEGGELYDAFAACDVDIRQQFVDSLAADEDVSEEAAACLDNAIDSDLLRRLIVTTLTQGDEALDEDTDLVNDFNSAVAPCQPTTTTAG